MSPEDSKLSASDFCKAVNRFLDDNKPDKLVERQMKEWRFLWEPKVDDDASGERQSLSGRLHWSNQYVTCRLDTTCTWTGDRKDGKLTFSCQARMKMSAQAPSGAGDPTRKAHNTMIRRLEGDDYVKKLTTDPVAFIDASVEVAPDSLRESVSLENHFVIKAIQRALFSQTENKLDVYELILGFPFLPVAQTRLADRLRLRVLEDAAFEACEDEEEEKMVEDLTISKKQRNE